mgnify:CR=1 FL=1
MRLKSSNKCDYLKNWVVETLDKVSPQDSFHFDAICLFSQEELKGIEAAGLSPATQPFR